MSHDRQRTNGCNYYRDRKPANARWFWRCRNRLRSKSRLPTIQPKHGRRRGRLGKTRIFLHSITKGGDGHGRAYTQGENLTRTDFQQKSKTIQASIVHSFDYADVNARTPEDVADLVRDLLDSPDAIENLRGKGIFVQNVGDVRPIFFVNDKDRNEQTPNFDLLVNYATSITKGSGYVDVADSVVEGV